MLIYIHYVYCMPIYIYHIYYIHTSYMLYTRSWFNDNCKQSIRDRKKALRIFKQHPTQDNLSSFRIARAKARRIVRQSKKESWQKYVSRLNSRTSVKATWDMDQILKHLPDESISTLLDTSGEFKSSHKFGALLLSFRYLNLVRTEPTQRIIVLLH